MSRRLCRRRQANPFGVVVFFIQSWIIEKSFRDITPMVAGVCRLIRDESKNPLGGPVLAFGFFKSSELSQRIKRLKTLSLFATLTPAELKIVDGLLHERSFLADEIIFDEGEDGQALYVLLSGRVRVSRSRESQTEVIAELSTGDFFGDLALLDNSPRSAQVRAIENCEFAVFFRADFLALLGMHPVIGYKISLELARHIGRRLRDWVSGKSKLELL